MDTIWCQRDLMFIGAGIWDSGRLPAEEESLFYKGYGQTEINQDAICYYRFERIIQDIGEYCEHIFYLMKVVMIGCSHLSICNLISCQAVP